MKYEIRANNTIVDPDTEEVYGRVPSELGQLFSNSQNLLEDSQAMFSELCHVKLSPLSLRNLMKLGRSIIASGGSTGFWFHTRYYRVNDFDKAEEVLTNHLKERFPGVPESLLSNVGPVLTIHEAMLP